MNSLSGVATTNAYPLSVTIVWSKFNGTVNDGRVSLLKYTFKTPKPMPQSPKPVVPKFPFVTKSSVCGASLTNDTDDKLHSMHSNNQPVGDRGVADRTTQEVDKRVPGKEDLSVSNCGEYVMRTVMMPSVRSGTALGAHTRYRA